MFTDNTLQVIAAEVGLRIDANLPLSFYTGAVEEPDESWSCMLALTDSRNVYKMPHPIFPTGYDASDYIARYVRDELPEQLERYGVRLTYQFTEPV